MEMEIAAKMAKEQAIEETGLKEEEIGCFFIMTAFEQLFRFRYINHK